jgi:hypothetical protein
MRRCVTTGVVVAGLAVALAGPASAEDFGGTYSLTLIGAVGGGNALWTANSSCAPSGGCVSHISSSTGWSGDAQLAGGRWTMTVNRRDGQSCPDGSRHSESQTWSWDAATLSGQVSGVSFDPIACPQSMPDAFTLTKVHTGGATYA